MKTTFLQGYKPLVKRFTPQGVDAYPQVKRVTSHEFELPTTREGLTQRFNLIKKHAGHGCGLLKGNLNRPLVQESRSGVTNNDAPAYNIVLDIDGVRPMDLHCAAPYSREDIAAIAAYFIGWLPTCFQKASYIIHASASLGTKPGVFSLHLDFLLETPIPVQMLKDYLLWLNFAIPQFEQELSLTATGTGLRYKLDKTLADNSRIIYIGHPIFEGVKDPIPKTDDRLQLIIKQDTCLDLSEELKAVDTAKLQRLIKNKISYLRQSSGLPPRQEKMAVARINGQMVTVVTNPDHLYMTLSYEKDQFIYYNINGGDSNAYYVYRSNPQVVYNFKGEPNFLFESADPEAYNQHLKLFGYGSTVPDDEDAPKTETPGIATRDPEKVDLTFPLVFRDKGTDKFYNALYNPTTNRIIEVNNVANEVRCENWMRENKGIPPEIIPSVDYVFQPNDKRSIDMPESFINRFMPTDMLLTPPPIDAKYMGIEYGYARCVEELCPTIHKIVDSIMGGGLLEYEHFINWLAYIVQFRDKTMKAWVCHGAPGTGKGLFMHNVMTQILGTPHSIMKGVGDLDENFNSWMQQSLLVAMDEFNANDTKSKGKLVNKLKGYITEPFLTLREMRADQKQIPNFSNFMFFSNDDAPVPIQAGDRRYNVAPLQKIPLNVRYPGLIEGIKDKLHRETPYFAAFLTHFKVSQAMAQTALENDAKNEMRHAGRTIVDEFCAALKLGTFSYFMNILEIDNAPNYADLILPAKNLMYTYLRKLSAGNFEQCLTVKEVRILYQALISTLGADSAMGKILSRNGVETKRETVRGLKQSVLQLKWNIEDINLETVLTIYNINSAPTHIRAVQ